MQAARKAVETIKETAANIGASAKSGLDKTKATVHEKAERMTAHDPTQKDMATQKKEERINHAEMEKQEAREHNAAAKQSATAGHMAEGHYTATGPGTETATYSTTGEYGQPMGANHMSATHGHGLGHGELMEDVMGSHQVGMNTGMGRTTGHNTHVGGTAPRSGPDFS
ncbi:18 kDa seed maturation protein-like [Gastrolobium bilobum]|uniref:18 kDa seed maturation protein-like n=1 Tax=Gastrolobium bilobum TaxID=150636 RepID=UPI002AB01155|nr:18 kDa seed maturation protein-like [Gastrolobium bilobum]